MSVNVYSIDYFLMSKNILLVVTIWMSTDILQFYWCNDVSFYVISSAFDSHVIMLHACIWASYVRTYVRSLLIKHDIGVSLPDTYKIPLLEKKQLSWVYVADLFVVPLPFYLVVDTCH